MFVWTVGSISWMYIVSSGTSRLYTAMSITAASGVINPTIEWIILECM